MTDKTYKVRHGQDSRFYFRAKGFIAWSLVILLFAVFFINYLAVDLWDYDFWWHISSGRYIATTGFLPESDPFSFTSAVNETHGTYRSREKEILRAYWLAQILFYILYRDFGPAGIIILRSLLLTVTILVAYKYLRRNNVFFVVSVVASVILYDVLKRSVAERPVLFSLLFSAIVFSLLDEFRLKLDRKLVFLPLIMLLWANMHGGFILGVIMLAIYAVTEAFMIKTGRAVYGKKDRLYFFGMIAAALIASLCNPNGWHAFVFLTGRYSTVLQGIQEYKSPIDYYFVQKIAPAGDVYAFLALAILFPALLIVRNRKMAPVHILLSAVMLIQALQSLRFISFYAVISSMILGREADSFIRETLAPQISAEGRKKVFPALSITALLSVGVFFFLTFRMPTGVFSVSKHSVPAAAVDFIERNRISGNMFNDYGNGGYLSWRLHPWKKNFIDSRALNPTVFMEHSMIMTAASLPIKDGNSIISSEVWAPLLKQYNIDLILIPLHDIVGNIPPLIYKLLESDEWSPVFLDQISIIFVRSISDNNELIRQYTIPPNAVYNKLIYTTSAMALGNPENLGLFIALGETFYKMGRIEDALTAYRYANKKRYSQALEDTIRGLEGEAAKKRKSE